MMTLTVFTNSNCLLDYLSGLLLSVSPIVGGGVASFAYAILAQGTYLDNIDNEISNCQGEGLKAMEKEIVFHGRQLMRHSQCIGLIVPNCW